MPRARWGDLTVAHQACLSHLSEPQVLLPLQHPSAPRTEGTTLRSPPSRAAPGAQGKGVRVYVCKTVACVCVIQVCLWVWGAKV